MDSLIQAEPVADLELVKRTIFPGATDDELKLYVFDCKRHGVHPMDRMIHPMVRTDKNGKRRYTPVTSIDLFRSRAASTGAHLGTEDAVFLEGGGDFPEAATVTVYRWVHGQRATFTATARWREYFPGDRAGGMWQKMPYTMLGKCAEALALRKAFPAELQGVYVREEMEQAKAVEAEPEATTPVTFDPDGRERRGFFVRLHEAVRLRIVPEIITEAGPEAKRARRDLLKRLDVFGEPEEFRNEEWQEANEKLAILIAEAEQLPRSD